MKINESSLHKLMTIAKEIAEALYYDAYFKNKRERNLSFKHSSSKS
jgi:hypothetical protein